MAKRTSNKTTTSRSKPINRAPTYTPRTQEKGFIKEMIANPAVRYVAGGIATAMLSKFVSKLSTKYPEISRFLSENLDTIESRLSDFRNNQSQDSEAVTSRH